MIAEAVTAPPAKIWASKNEVAQRLGVSTNTIDRYTVSFADNPKRVPGKIRMHRIPCAQEGGRPFPRYVWADVKALLPDVEE